MLLCNDEPVPGQAAMLGEVLLPFFCRFRVTSALGFQGPVPSTLRGGVKQPPRLAAPPKPHRVRDLTIAQLLSLRLPPALMSLNNLTFESDDIEMPVQGSVEQWNLINVTADPHPIHVHLAQFRVLGRQKLDTTSYMLKNPVPAVGMRWTPSAEEFIGGELSPPQAWETGFKDTVIADANSVTRVLIQFPTAKELGFDPDAPFMSPEAGHHGGESLRGYVWHCHIFDHEDHDMMLRYRLIPPDCGDCVEDDGGAHDGHDGDAGADAGHDAHDGEPGHGEHVHGVDPDGGPSGNADASPGRAGGCAVQPGARAGHGLSGLGLAGLALATRVASDPGSRRSLE